MPSKTLEWLRRRMRPEDEATSFDWHGERPRPSRSVGWVLMLAACLAAGFYLGRLSSSPEPRRDLASMPDKSAADAPVAAEKAAPLSQPNLPQVAIPNASDATPRDPAASDEIGRRPRQSEGARRPAEQTRPPAQVQTRSRSMNRSAGAGRIEPEEREGSRQTFSDYDDLRQYMLRQQ